MKTITRAAERTDIPNIATVLESSGLFPVKYLKGMMADYLDNPDSAEYWFVREMDGQSVGFGYCVPEKFASGTFNLLAIAVDKREQGNGLGKAMISYLENFLKAKGGRILIIETSSGDEFAATRKFYERLNYSKEAFIRDFWEEGEDKIIYWKKLNE